jgi:hypothetical protein
VLHLTWDGVDGDNREVRHYYRMAIPGGQNGINNGNGRYMKENVEVYLHPTYPYLYLDKLIVDQADVGDPDLVFLRSDQTLFNGKTIDAFVADDGRDAGDVSSLFDVLVTIHFSVPLSEDHNNFFHIRNIDLVTEDLSAVISEAHPATCDLLLTDLREGLYEIKIDGSRSGIFSGSDPAAPFFMRDDFVFYINLKERQVP